MALTITPGYTFIVGEKLTPDKLNQFIDDATVTGLGATNFAGGSAQIVFYGNTSPTPQRARLWYDTTAGSEGLKYAFLSASNSSISTWLYRTPRCEGIFWTNTTASLGSLFFVGNNRQSAVANDYEYASYDGNIFPIIWPYGSTTGANPLYVIAMQSVAASNPVKCAWAGLIPVEIGNSPAAAGQHALLTYAGPTNIRPQSNYKAFAREACAGLLMVNTTGGQTASVTSLLFVTPAYEDMNPAA